MAFIDRLVGMRRFWPVQQLLLLYGIEIPERVTIGEDLQLIHRGHGTKIHPDTTIGDRVRIYHNVTVGRADAHIPRSQSRMERIVIEDDVVLFPGSVVLGGAGITTVGRGTIVGANAVLTKSTGENEIWAGIPAKCVGLRTAETESVA